MLQPQTAKAYSANEKHPCGCFSRYMSRNDVWTIPNVQTNEAGQEVVMSVASYEPAFSE